MKEIGLVGTAGVGKTTVLTALTGNHGVASASGRAHVAMVEVPDPRVDLLVHIEKSRKRVGVQVRFIDVAGLASAEGGSRLSAQGLGQLREADALAFVIGAFTSPADLAARAGDLLLDLTVADLAVLEGAAVKAAKRARLGLKEAVQEAAAFDRAVALLSEGISLRSQDWDAAERQALRNVAPLTLKPAVVVLNVADDGVAEAEKQINDVQAAVNAPVCVLAAGLEAEVAGMDPEDAHSLLAEFGIHQGGLDQVVAAAWRELDLLTFFTTGEDETRAWEVHRGATAPEAAGQIHSDLQKGFIRAEVVGFDDLVAASGWDAARSQGKLRVEGRSYVVAEGDCLHIRFNR